MTSKTQKSTQLDKTLQNLVCSGRCQLDAANDYGEKLKEFARENAEPEEMDRQSRIFKALGDKTRLGILNLISTREMCVCELMAALELTQPTASHHLGILENAGVIKERKDSKWVFYRIADEEIRTLLRLRR
jgi:DNA-binding transcriptional ArsR family regulator